MDVTLKRLFVAVSLTVLSAFAVADTLTLKSGHPEAYTVVKGDTLWDISAKFLEDPWLWPKLWGANPQVSNPHLIYPGDRLTLVFIDGEPRLVKKAFIKRSPEGRVQSKNGPIPPVQLSAIQAYLSKNRVVESEWLEEQPQLLSGETNRKYHVSGQQVYSQGEFEVGQRVGIYRIGRSFTKQTVDGIEPLGTEIILSASGIVRQSGDVNVIELKSDYSETTAGDKVIAIDDSSLMPAYFMPQAGSGEDIRVLATNNGARAVGNMEVIYLDAGAEQGLQPGQVFSGFRQGKRIVIDSKGKPVQPNERSRYNRIKANFSEENALNMPDVYHGEVMVFKVFDKVSLGIVLRINKPLRVDDKLKTPVELAKSFSGSQMR
ncbi:LysM peptidoglycan-binding domain-containing protein [Paraferrimonas sedimenticola]|uniref:Peptidoglycan-binding protein LysM n=1 Tax=Paraferrimonas sedimenticola TaxID=375674 RepID=A0AA37RZD0_9GAMM|nr:LysM peptidoglycan-binding domain-containing protein [Paraferrimonas sedimenticola]GLP97697.1 peptidoglycan-binding protein LysM [Paraferrimonas sedimenticola]